MNPLSRHSSNPVVMPELRPQVLKAYSFKADFFEDTVVVLRGEPLDLTFSLVEIHDHIVFSFRSQGWMLDSLLYGSRASHVAGGPAGNDWDMLVCLPEELRVELNLDSYIDACMLNLVRSRLRPDESDSSYMLVGKPIPGGGCVYKFGADLDIVFKFGAPQSYSALDSVYIHPVTASMYFLDGSEFVQSAARVEELRAQICRREWVRLGPDNLSYLRFMHHWAHGTLIPPYEIERSRQEFRRIPAGVRADLLRKHQSQHFRSSREKLIDLLNHLTLAQDDAEDCRSLASDWIAAGCAFQPIAEAIRAYPSSTPLILKFIRGCLLHAYLLQNGHPGPVEAWTFRGIPSDQPRNFFSVPCDIPRYLAIANDSRIVSVEEVSIDYLEALVALSAMQCKPLDDCRKTILLEIGLDPESFLQDDCSSGLKSFLEIWVGPYASQIRNQVPLTSPIAYNQSARALCRWLVHKFGPSQVLQQQLARYALEDHIPSVQLEGSHRVVEFLRTVLTNCQAPTHQFQRSQFAAIVRSLNELCQSPEQMPQSLREPIEQLLQPRIRGLVRRLLENGSHSGAHLALAFVYPAASLGLFSEQGELRFYRFLLRTAKSCSFQDSDWAILVHLLLLERGADGIGLLSDHQRKLCSYALATSQEVLSRKVTKPPIWIPPHPRLHSLLASRNVLETCPAVISCRQVLSSWRTVQRSPCPAEYLQALAYIAQELPYATRPLQLQVLAHFVPSWHLVPSSFQTPKEQTKAYRYSHAIRALSGEKADLVDACSYFKIQARKSRKLALNILQGILFLQNAEWNHIPVHSLDQAVERVSNSHCENRRLLDAVLHRLLPMASTSHWLPVSTLVHRLKGDPLDGEKLCRWFLLISFRCMEQGSYSLLHRIYRRIKSDFPRDVLAPCELRLAGYLAKRLWIPLDAQPEVVLSKLKLAQKLLPLYSELAPEEARQVLQRFVDFAHQRGELVVEVNSLWIRANGIGLFDLTSPQERHHTVLKLLEAVHLSDEYVPLRTVCAHLNLIHKLGVGLSLEQTQTILCLGVGGLDRAMKACALAGQVDISDLRHFIDALIGNIRRSAELPSGYLIIVTSFVVRSLYLPSIIRLICQTARLQTRKGPKASNRDVLDWIQKKKQVDLEELLTRGIIKHSDLDGLTEAERKLFISQAIQLCMPVSLPEFERMLSPDLASALAPMVLSLFQCLCEKPLGSQRAGGPVIEASLSEYVAWQTYFYKQLQKYTQKSLQGEELRKATVQLKGIENIIRKRNEGPR